MERLQRLQAGAGFSESIDLLEMNCDVVRLDRTVIGEHGIDPQNLESAALQIIHVSAQDVVRFALEFRSSLRRAFFRGQQFCVEPVGAGLPAGILLEELHAWIVGSTRLWLIVKPASRRQQNERKNRHNHQVVRPASALVRPENCADTSSPQLSHFSELKCRSRPFRRACAVRDFRKWPLPDCA
jgi:hypothetical protein